LVEKCASQKFKKTKEVEAKQRMTLKFVVLIYKGGKPEYIECMNIAHISLSFFFCLVFFASLIYCFLCSSNSPIYFMHTAVKESIENQLSFISIYIPTKLQAGFSKPFTLPNYVY